MLRAWERRYGVVSPTRSEGGQRLYSELDIERLLRLRRLTERGHAIGRLAGLALSELARLEEETPALAAPGETESVTTAASAALEATRRLDAVELQAVLERAAMTLGVPVFLDHVVSPLLVQISGARATLGLGGAGAHGLRVIRRVLGWLLRLYEVRNGAPRVVVTTPPLHAHELAP